MFYVAELSASGHFFKLALYDNELSKLNYINLVFNNNNSN